ncbi:MAG: hypothetical protein KAS01_00230 [Candidatus Pacebacteria bacterium]|nr:hypothetical protein [Candidatus Paceibacterota bacterium]
MEKLNKKIILTGLIVIFFFLVILAVLFTLPGNRKQVNQFDNCQVLDDSCKDQSCKYLFLCNETEFSDCEVYDCGNEYKMRILDKEGNIKEKTRPKPDQTKVQEMINKCKGAVEVLDKKECENGKAVANVKIETFGECIVNGFTMKIDGKNRIARFEKEGDIYNLSVRQCGEISDIKAIGEGGVEIREIEISVTNIENQEIIDMYRDKHYLP